LAHRIEYSGAYAIKFTTDEWKEFNKQLVAIKISGARLPAAVQQYSDVEAPLEKN
jgi:hypothetical protein